jgi:hypothetical protein
MLGLHDPPKSDGPYPKFPKAASLPKQEDFFQPKDAITFFKRENTSSVAPTPSTLW